MVRDDAIFGVRCRTAQPHGGSLIVRSANRGVFYNGIRSGVAYHNGYRLRYTHVTKRADNSARSGVRAVFGVRVHNFGTFSGMAIAKIPKVTLNPRTFDIKRFSRGESDFKRGLARPRLCARDSDGRVDHGLIVDAVNSCVSVRYTPTA